MMELKKISAPHETTITRVDNIHCENLGGRWTVITNLYGSIFQNEQEELLCKINTGMTEEWWSCGDCRFGVEDNIINLYTRYHRGSLIKIEWFKRSLSD